MNGEEDPYISRAASYTNLPRLVEPDGAPIKRTFSENVLSVSSEPPRPPAPEEQASGKEILRRSSTRRVNGSPNMNVTTFALSQQEESPIDSSYSPKVAVAVERIDRAQKTRSVSGSFGSFARRPWFSSSPTRSPSPSPVDKKAKPEKLGQTSPAKSPKKPPKAQIPRTLQYIPPPADQAPVVARKGTVLSKGRRPLSALLPQRKPEVDAAKLKSPSTHSLRKSKSFEKLPGLKLKTTAEKVPPIPPSFSSERLQAIGLDYSKKKDELWSVFRTLEGDYSK
jgi:hypothetical protein